LVYQSSVSLKESYVILQIPGSFAEEEKKWMHAQKSQYTEMKKATEDKTQYVCFWRICQSKVIINK